MVWEILKTVIYTTDSLLFQSIVVWFAKKKKIHTFFAIVIYVLRVAESYFILILQCLMLNSA